MGSTQTITCPTSGQGFLLDHPLPVQKARESIVRSEVDIRDRTRDLRTLDVACLIQTIALPCHWFISKGRQWFESIFLTVIVCR